jgi:hypothetical protein
MINIMTAVVAPAWHHQAMTTRTSAAALLSTATITTGYMIAMVLVVLLGSVLLGLRLYRNQKLHGGEAARLSVDRSEAIWPAADSWLATSGWSAPVLRGCSGAFRVGTWGPQPSPDGKAPLWR